jgi:hypothetical protein
MNCFCPDIAGVDTTSCSQITGRPWISLPVVVGAQRRASGVNVSSSVNAKRFPSKYSTAPAFTSISSAAANRRPRSSRTFGGKCFFSIGNRNVYWIGTVVVLAGNGNMVLTLTLSHLVSSPFPNILGIIGILFSPDEEFPKTGEILVPVEPEVRCFWCPPRESVVEECPKRDGYEGRQQNEQWLPAEEVHRCKDHNEQDRY